MHGRTLKRKRVVEMPILEYDPRDMAAVALVIVILWRKPIDADQAWKIVWGKSNAKPARNLTPELMQRIKKIMESPNFKSFDHIETLYRVDRRDIWAALRAERTNHERDNPKGN